MKNPLSYQATEFDCGPTTVMNAVSYLFERKEISPDIVKNVMMYCLDGYNSRGEAYKRGTTDSAMRFIAEWFNQYGRARRFPIECSMLSGPAVQVGNGSAIDVCLQNGGAVIAKVMLGCYHYVLMTGFDGEYVYLFDPYYRERQFCVEGIENIWDCPQKMNKKVRLDYFDRVSRCYYSFGPEDKREAMIMYNTKLSARRGAARTAPSREAEDLAAAGSRKSRKHAVLTAQ